MAEAFTADLRVQVLANYDLGVHPAELSLKYRVSERWIYSLIRRRRHLGTIEPLYGRPGLKPILAPHLDHPRALIQQRPEATLEDPGSTLNNSPDGIRARSA